MLFAHEKGLRLWLYILWVLIFVTFMEGHECTNRGSIYGENSVKPKEANNFEETLRKRILNFTLDNFTGEGSQLVK